MTSSQFFCSVVVFLSVSFVSADDCVFPGSTRDWNGFVRHDFDVDGRGCRVVCPKKAASGKPWIWRARFWAHEPQADLALLEKGFHVVYMDVAGFYGSPKAVDHWDSFYEFLTAKHNFSKKPALEGMSRGGLIIYNWAIKNPQKVACIYADAPVLDIRSWPGGKGRGNASRSDWEECLDAYAISEAEAVSSYDGPLDNLETLVAAGIPILHVVGAIDIIVPVSENSRILEKRYREFGGDIKVITKPDTGHHPHSLKDPKPIVDFITAHAMPRESPAGQN
jgi:hypothetical protein